MDLIAIIMPASVRALQLVYVCMHVCLQGAWLEHRDLYIRQILEANNRAAVPAARL